MIPSIQRIMEIEPPEEPVKKKKIPLPVRMRKGSNQLTKNQWEVFRLLRVEGVSYGEASKRLGRSYITIATSWYRIQKKIAASPERQALTGIKP